MGRCGLDATIEPMTATLVAKGLAGGYAHRVLFDNLDLTVAPGDVIGVLPTYAAEDANEFVEVAICTGMQHARNVVVVATADVVFVVGGKSGTLCCAEARRRTGPKGDGGLVIGVSPLEADCRRMRELGWVDHALQVDARDALAVMAAVAAVTDGRLADAARFRTHRPIRRRVDGRRTGRGPAAGGGCGAARQDHDPRIRMEGRDARPTLRDHP